MNTRQYKNLKGLRKENLRDDMSDLELVLTMLADCGALSMGALIAGYFFESIMFPTIFALSLRGLGEKTKRASSFLMMTPVGGAVGPWLMGWMADAHGMVLSFVVPLAGFVVVWIYSIFTLKNSKQ